MNMQFNSACDRVQETLRCESSEEIIVRLDNAGFIVEASDNAARLGVDLDSLLVMPHIADFASGDRCIEVARYFQDIMAGRRIDDSIEFEADICRSDEAAFSRCKSDETCSEAECGHWFRLSLRLVLDPEQRPLGAVGTLHSVQRKYSHDRPSRDHPGTDPVTGLPGRPAFVRSLADTIASGRKASMATFAIDGSRAIFMQFGQRTADEIRWGFARFLETMTEQRHELAQVDDERFGVLLTGANPREAREWAAEVLQTFAGLAMGSSSRAPELTASAGLAPVEHSADWTLRQAELGLVMARAGGGMQTAICQPASGIASGQTVELAMEAAVQRALQRYA
jgi:GGDEF domain-containing protein